MRIHALILSLIFCAAGLLWGAAFQNFSLLNYYPGWYFAPLESNTFAFPYRGGSFPAFVVQTNAARQDISAGAITATFRVVATDDARFTFGGEGRWNTGPMPPHARLFFSSRLGYYAEDGCPECSWWSADGWQVISNGTFTITASFDPARWSHSHGQTNAAAFAAALTNVIEAGVSFGGGSFFDIGVGLTAGNATFEMLALDFIPPGGAVKLPLADGLNCISTSTDLTNWTALTARTGPGVMRIPVGTDPQRFWRSVHD